MTEIWEDIPGYEGLYQVSNHGRVKCLPKVWFSGMGNNIKRSLPERIKGVRSTGNGYNQTTLHKDGVAINYTIHRLVAQSFIPNPDNKPQINHKDGNKKNNHVSNLEWCTSAENVNHSWDMGLSKVYPGFGQNNGGANNGNAKKVIQMDVNGKIIKEWGYVEQAASELGFGAHNISACACNRQITAHGYKWKYA